MKTILLKIFTGVILTISFLIGIFSCEDRNFDNPYDPEVEIDSLAPYDLAIEDISIVEKKLSWKCEAENYDAFVIDKKTGQGNWAKVTKVDERVFEWTDSDIKPNQTYQYRIKTKFDEKFISEETISFEASIPAPSDLQIQKNTIGSVSLTWQDNSTGEEGFKVERSYDGSSWNEITTTQNNSFKDDDFDLNTKVYYRVNTFYQDYASGFTEVYFEATIPAAKNFKVMKNSNNTVTLNWEYAYSGHDGFQIDRKVDDESWEAKYETVGAATISLTDDVDLENHDYSFRLFVILDSYQSAFLEQNISIYFTDSRDGRRYLTVEIGTQVWFAENLNFDTNNSWWYDNDPEYGETYGRLYTWEAALDVCPDGWHLPTDEEWKTLEIELGMSQSVVDNTQYRGTDQGSQMKSTSGWNNNGNGNNSSGFNALPGGYRSSGGWSFNYLGDDGHWWSATEYSDARAWIRSLSHTFDKVSRTDGDKMAGFNIRCLKD